jgi:LPS export ABC transporter protein LptC
MSKSFFFRSGGKSYSRPALIKFLAMVWVLALIFWAWNFSEAKPAAKPKANGESDQQISDFSLAGYGEKGKKSWDLNGKSADIFDEVVKLKDIKGNLFSENEHVVLLAEKGDFNKADGKVHLEDNVVITTSAGAKLTTDTLDWDRRKQLVSTPDKVHIEKEDMVTTATGALGHPDLNKVTLQKDVTVKINSALDAKQTASMLSKDQIIITCDGPLEVDYQHNIATFKNNVTADKGDAVIYCDTMDIYFNNARDKGAPKSDNAKGPLLSGSKIDQIVAKGNVKIVKGENVSFSDEAIYTGADQKIVLKGKPKLVIYSTADFKEAFGN